MKRFAAAAVVVFASAMSADAQPFDAGPLYHSPVYGDNAIGRYYPASRSGFYMMQPSGFGLVSASRPAAYCTAPGGLYQPLDIGFLSGTPAIPPPPYPTGVVLANPFSPGYLYNDAIYAGINSYGAMYTPSRFDLPVYVYRPGPAYSYLK